MTQTITALFDRPAEAQAAQTKLVAAGIPQSAIKLVQGAQTARTSGSYDYHKDEGGFWGSLKDFFMPEEDRYAYSEGLNRGGTLLTASVEPTQTEIAYDILEQNGSVDLDQRESTWRKEGWSGYSATGGTTAAGSTAGMAAAGTTAAGTAATGATSLKGAGTTTGETDYIPVVEERLNVGKRVAESGRVRVRSFVVEKPVEEQVTLRDETVHVDRRVVDRPVTAADEALFASKTIEATEMREQAVVSKEARVVEEVGIRKDAGQRTETITDKVRHTEVEVEDERGNVSRTGTTGATTTATTPGTRKPV
ncbi:YsnF/AvaK domain-containing protein [Methylobacterium sp. J-030]|uniref:YsnF/AvaK domain-containing protein n=1 Tax=Methylobacterium sp. J-030 TaxID=2836627 RepID=UPI001FB9C4B4|nr:YsnF/AvaK domain-containing protein [Methylobacterium sp. J-030]MCJ2072768.1 YsnF/AvaK domain-containing protein [Methylobacterium sp. J-030]